LVALKKRRQVALDLEANDVACLEHHCAVVLRQSFAKVISRLALMYLDQVDPDRKRAGRPPDSAEEFCDGN
jgi:hypothetical protein